MKKNMFVKEFGRYLRELSKNFIKNPYRSMTRNEINNEFLKILQKYMDEKEKSLDGKFKFVLGDC